MNANQNQPNQEIQKAQITLTEEQKNQLTKVFGKEIIDKLEAIEIEQIAGYLKANAHVN